MIRVTGLFLYPVKSLRGFPVASAEMDELGFAGDRRFLVVDKSGNFMTQRTVPRMALVSTALSGGSLHLAADGAPLLATTTASLDELNRRILENGGSPVPMDRFRPNIVLEGGEPFAEDDWAALDIAGVRFRAAGPCKRCIVTTADQLTGLRGKEPLRTLAKFRRDPLDSSATIFGLNLIQETKSGLVTIGDPAGITSA
jgi:uncharacterized protein YcbX